MKSVCVKDKCLKVSKIYILVLAGYSMWAQASHMQKRHLAFVSSTQNHFQTKHFQFPADVSTKDVFVLSDLACHPIHGDKTPRAEHWSSNAQKLSSLSSYRKSEDVIVFDFVFLVVFFVGQVMFSHHSPSKAADKKGKVAVDCRLLKSFARKRKNC